MLDERKDHVDHLGRVLGRFDIVVGLAPTECFHVVEKAAGFPLAQLIPGHAELFRFAQDVVVDIGHVLDVGNRLPKIREIAHENVERQVGERVTGVGRVVRRHAADIEPKRVVLELDRFQRCRTAY